MYLLAISEDGKVFLEFVKRPLSSPTLFWTVIVQVLTAGTQESGKKIREIFLPCGKKIQHFTFQAGYSFSDGWVGWSWS